MITKTCKDCQTEKDISLFSLVNKKTGQRRPECNPCKLLREKAQYESRRANDGPRPQSRCCTKCGESKPLDSQNFKNRKASPHGLTPMCKACLSVMGAEWARTEKGKAIRARLSPRYAEHRKAYAKAYQKANRKQINLYLAEWRLKNIDRCRALGAAWARKNKEKRTVYRHARRAAGAFSYAVIPELMKQQGGKCTACHGLLTKFVEIDHIFPVALGGTNEKSNLQLLCRPCNRSKGAKHPIDFMQSRGFLL